MNDEVPSISCSFSSENSLYLAYMPFIKNGGLFIRTKNDYELGSEVNLSIQLLKEPEAYKIQGRVVWITPKGAQSNKPAGIGVQFIDDKSRSVCNKIETFLAGMLKSTHLTDTI